MEPQQQAFDPGGKLSVRSWTSKLQLEFLLISTKQFEAK